VCLLTFWWFDHRSCFSATAVASPLACSSDGLDLGILCLSQASADAATGSSLASSIPAAPAFECVPWSLWASYVVGDTYKEMQKVMRGGDGSENPKSVGIYECGHGLTRSDWV
jgi:hypothetical protein